MTVPNELYVAALTDPGLDLYELLVHAKDACFEDLSFHEEFQGHYKHAPYLFAVVNENTHQTFGGKVVNTYDRLLHLFCTKLKPNSKQLLHSARKISPQTRLHVRIIYNFGWVEALICKDYVCYVRKLAENKYLAVRYDARTETEHVLFYGFKSSNLPNYAREYERPAWVLLNGAYRQTTEALFRSVRKNIFQRNTKPNPTTGVLEFVERPWHQPHTCSFSIPNTSKASAVATFDEGRYGDLGVVGARIINGFIELSRELFIDSDFIPPEQLPQIIKDSDGTAVGIQVLTNPKTGETTKAAIAEIDPSAPTLAEAFMCIVETKSTYTKLSLPTGLVFDDENFIVMDMACMEPIFFGKYRGFSAKAYYTEGEKSSSLKIVNSRGDMHIVDIDSASGYREYIWDGTTCDLVTAGTIGTGIIISANLMLWYKSVLCLKDLPNIN